MTRTPDERALLAAVIVEPKSDAARLVFADMLTENARLAGSCSNCSGRGHHGPVAAASQTGWECSGCRGSGVVSDGREEYATFIRTQVDLAIQRDPKRRPPASEANDRLQDELSRRERELFDRHKCEWFGERSAIHYLLGEREDAESQYPDLVTSIVARGFIRTVRGPLKSLRGTTCDDCDGTGKDAALPADDWTCRTCHGIGRVGGVLMGMVGSQPVERVEVANMTIFKSGGNDTFFVGNLGIFAPKYWRELDNHRTRKSALDALSRVMLAEARDDAAKAGAR